MDHGHTNFQNVAKSRIETCSLSSAMMMPAFPAAVQIRFVILLSSTTVHYRTWPYLPTTDLLTEKRRTGCEEIKREFHHLLYNMEFTSNEESSVIQSFHKLIVTHKNVHFFCSEIAIVNKKHGISFRVMGGVKHLLEGMLRRGEVQPDLSK